MTKRKFTAEQFLLDLGRYVSLVQSNVHVKRARVAMLWSAISFFYIVFGLEVNSADVSTLWGVAIDNIEHWKFLVFLFAMTLYYAVRFGFSVVKIHTEVNPYALRREFFDQRKVAKSSFQDPPIKSGDDFMAHAFICMWVEHPDMVMEIHQRSDNKKSILDAEKLAGVEKESEVRQSLRHPTLAFLENYCALMLLPALVCAGALALLVAEIFFLIRC